MVDKTSTPDSLNPIWSCCNKHFLFEAYNFGVELEHIGGYNGGYSAHPRASSLKVHTFK